MPNVIRPNVIPAPLPRAGDRVFFRNINALAGNQWIAADMDAAVMKYVGLATLNQKPSKEIFDLILNAFNEVYGIKATIAGGAVRDLYLDTTCKDIDIFIPLRWEDFKAAEDELGWRDKAKENLISPYAQNKPPEFKSTKRASLWFKHFQLDLIFMDCKLTPELVRSFPIYTQRCVYTVEDGINIAPEAQKDMDNKTITIDPMITDRDYIKHLKARIVEWKKREPYKDWKMIAPKQKEWWAEVNERYNNDKMPF